MSMFGIVDIYSYLIGTVLIIILPGANSLYCLSTAASYGKKAGLQAMAGVLLGDTLLILATVLGAGTLMRLYPHVFEAIKLIGGLYLAYLGVRLFIGAYHNFKNRHTVAELEFTKRSQLTHSPFYRSLTLSLTNPKAILFFLSFFVQFVDVHYPYPLLSFFILACLLQLISFSYLMFLVISGEMLAHRFRSRPWLVIGAMLAVGALFIGFAVNLWLSKLS